MWVRAYLSLCAGVSCAQALDTLDAAGLQLPLVAKPRFAGQPGSHGLALVRDLAGLQALVLGGPDAPLRPPLLLQQFVEHGSTLTKVPPASIFPDPICCHFTQHDAAIVHGIFHYHA